MLLQAMRQWGALDADYKYVKSDAASNRRGYDQDPGCGLTSVPTFSDPIRLQDVLKSVM